MFKYYLALPSNTNTPFSQQSASTTASIRNLFGYSLAPIASDP